MNKFIVPKPCGGLPSVIRSSLLIIGSTVCERGCRKPTCRCCTPVSGATPMVRFWLRTATRMSFRTKIFTTPSLLRQLSRLSTSMLLLIPMRESRATKQTCSMLCRQATIVSPVTLSNWLFFCITLLRWYGKFVMMPLHLHYINFIKVTVTLTTILKTTNERNVSST